MLPPRGDDNHQKTTKPSRSEPYAHLRDCLGRFASLLWLSRRKRVDPRHLTPSLHPQHTSSSSENKPKPSIEATRSANPMLTTEECDYMATSTLFQKLYPEFLETGELDELRRQEFGRLDKSRIVYMDYMGACLYPDFLIRDHVDTLRTGLFGNTHSDSPTSKTSELHVAEARSAVLSFFSAPPEEYVCIFTSNCTAALKIVGESFPFEPGSQLVLAEDSHNSVNGLRSFARSKGGLVDYVPVLTGGGFDEDAMIDRLREPCSSPSLLALTAQSNISGFRPDLWRILSAAKQHGKHTLVDAAALASTSIISLGSAGATPEQETNDESLQGKVDAMAISFYKMFGYPTGVGALVARKDFLAELKRPWFAGGTVELVGVPSLVTEVDIPWERFEEGTLNFTALPALMAGLKMLQELLVPKPLSVLSLRLSILHQWLHDSLADLKHRNGQTVVRVMTHRPSLTHPPIPELSSAKTSHASGYVLALTFHRSNGEQWNNDEVSRLAGVARISLRTGCMCNPGGAAGLMDAREGLLRIEQAAGDQPGHCIRFREVERYFERQVGVIRLSLGLATNFWDVWQVLRFARGFVE